MVSTSKPLQRAKASFFMSNASSPPKDGGSWETITSFETLRDFYSRSFAGTDKVAGEPLMDWMAEYFDGISREEWQEATRFFMSYAVKEALNKGAVAFGKKLPEDGAVNDGYASVVIVREYCAPKEARWIVKAGDILRDAMLTGCLIGTIGLPAVLTEKKWSLAGKGATRAFDNMAKSYKTNHKAIMSCEKHWYVNMVGSNPESSGQGHGSQLMQKVVALADEAGMSCFLEANNEKNKRFYEKFGFKCEKTGEIQNEWEPEGEPNPVFYMVRRTASKQ